MCGISMFSMSGRPQAAQRALVNNVGESRCANPQSAAATAAAAAAGRRLPVQGRPRRDKQNKKLKHKKTLGHLKHKGNFDYALL